jgi:hypothetical protein
VRADIDGELQPDRGRNGSCLHSVSFDFDSIDHESEISAPKLLDHFHNPRFHRQYTRFPFRFRFRFPFPVPFRFRFRISLAPCQFEIVCRKRFVRPLIGATRRSAAIYPESPFIR